MEEGLLTWILRLSIGLAVALTAGSLYLADARITTGVAVGGAVAVGNLWALRGLGRRLVSRYEQDASASSTLLLMLGKFAILAAVLAALFFLVPMDTRGLLAGLSVVVIAVLAGTLLGPAPSTEAAGEVGPRE